MVPRFGSQLEFQSAPTVVGGSNTPHIALSPIAASFNPLPPLLVGVTFPCWRLVWISSEFQSAPTVVGGSNVSAATVADRLLVSIRSHRCWWE